MLRSLDYVAGHHRLTATYWSVEDERRTLLMRTHSGLHVMCGVVFRDFGALVTGGNMQPGEARMDFNLPEVPEGFKERVAQACAEEVAADRERGVELFERGLRRGVVDLREHVLRPRRQRADLLGVRPRPARQGDGQRVRDGR